MTGPGRDKGAYKRMIQNIRMRTHQSHNQKTPATSVAGSSVARGLLGRREPDTHKLIILLLTIAMVSLFLFSKIDVFMTTESDGYFHYLGAFFMYDAFKWWVSSPTPSFDAIRDFVISYQAHYKFFGGIAYYQPFHSFFVAFLALFSGKHALTFYLATALETALTMAFAFRLYGLLYRGRNRAFQYLAMLMVGFAPAVFNLAASYSLEPGVMLFSMMTAFYFIRYMRLGKRNDLFFAAASAGLGMLTKTPFAIIFPMLLLSVILERKHGLFLRDWKALLISAAIFLAVLSPWLLMELAFSQLGISKLGERAATASLDLGPYLEIRLFNLGKTLWAVFGSCLLVPFFLYKFLRTRLTTGELTMLVIIILWPLYYNLLSNALVESSEFIQVRYLTAAAPFAIVLSVRGIQALNERKWWRPYIPLNTGLILLTMVLGSFGHVTHQKTLLASTDVLSPAIYVSDNSNNRTTVMATFSKMFAAAFCQLEDENIYVVRSPFDFEGGEEELEIMLDSTDYVRRPSKPEWEEFNITHPPIDWVLVPEYYDGVEHSYLLRDAIEHREDFELARVFEGAWPGNRVFVYRRI
jgi:hypothetical protein